MISNKKQNRSLDFSKVFLAVICFLLITTTASFGELNQVFKDETSKVIFQEKMDALRSNIEDRIKRIGNQALGDKRFAMVIELSIDESKLASAINAQAKNSAQLQTLPTKLKRPEIERAFVESLNGTNVRRFVSKMAIALAFEDSVNDVEKDLIKKQVSQAVALDSKRGDKLEISSQNLSNTTETLKKEITAKVDAEKRQFDLAKNQYDVVKNQYDVVKNQFTSRIKNLEEANADLRTQVKKLEDELSIYKTPLGDLKRTIKGLELPLTILPIAVILLLLLTVFMFLFHSMNKVKVNRMVEGISMLSQAIGKKSGGGKENSTADLAALLKARDDSGGGASSAAASQSAGQQISPEDLQELRSAAIQAWESLSDYEYLTTAEIKEWIYQGDMGRKRVIALLNALPPKDSAQIMSVLAKEDNEKLKGISGEPGDSIIGRTIILNLARQILSELQSKPDFVKKLKAWPLITTSDRLLADEMVLTPPEVQGALLHALPRSRLLRILDALSGKDPETVANAIGYATLQITMDVADPLAPLLETLKTRLEGTNKEIGIILIEELSNVLDQMPPKTRSLIEATSARFKEFANALQQRIVTIEHVLAMDNDTLNELIDPLDPSQLAALFISLSEKDQKKIATIISQKTLIMVQGELPRMNRTPQTKKRALAQGMAVQFDLVQGLKRLVAEGMVDIPKLSTSPDEQSDPGRKNAA